ncbi:MAG TPA: hypothetical protein VK420_10410 [Longimicrobium sp.]|nr:hypothetical protein [Longimicrobium sp.]
MNSMAMLRRAAAMALLLGSASCSTEIVLTRNRHPGLLEVRPVDAAGTCVLGVSLEFTPPDGGVSRGTNAFQCPFTSGGEPGEWSVRVTPPQGYVLAAGQESVVRAVVRRDETTAVTVRLARATP